MIISKRRRAPDDARTIQSIVRAFRSAPYPGDDGLLCTLSEEAWEFVEAFRGMHWLECDVDFLCPQDAPSRFADSLALVSADAFRFYLPAFMLVCVNGWGRCGAIPDSLEIVLRPSTKDPGIHQLWRDRIGVLDAAQRQAVCRFLVWLARKYEDEAEQQEILSTIHALRAHPLTT